MLVRVKENIAAPGFLAVLYSPGQAFNFELGEGVTLPWYLEPAEAPASEAPAAPRRRKKEVAE